MDRPNFLTPDGDIILTADILKETRAQWPDFCVETGLDINSKVTFIRRYDIPEGMEERPWTRAVYVRMGNGRTVIMILPQRYFDPLTSGGTAPVGRMPEPRPYDMGAVHSAVLTGDGELVAERLGEKVAVALRPSEADGPVEAPTSPADAPDPMEARYGADAALVRPEGTAGVKKDAGKPRLDLVPAGATMDAARVFTFGADKYDRDDEGQPTSEVYRNNWRQGMRWRAA